MVARLLMVFRYPAVQFLFAGFVLFMIYAWTNPAQDQRRIVVGAAVIDGLEQRFLATYNRPPSQSELDGEIRRHVEEEILFREALSLNLHLTDEIVRRRLIGTMEFLDEGAAAFEHPVEDDLRDDWQGRHGDFVKPARISLTHVFLSADEDPQAAQRRAEAVLPELQAGAAASRVGDLFLRGRVLRGKSRSALAELFGPRFADEAFTLPTGEWAGPIASPFGYHLVHVNQKVATRELAFEEVRDELEADWRRHRVHQIRAERLNDLVHDYEVIIETRAEGSGE